jgi:hypothetical protein
VKGKLSLTNNQLKIIAMLTMLIDHVGVYLYPSVEWLRIVGRISLPIFAYMIAEGCRHTKHRLRYFLQIAILALGCQLVFFFAMGSLYQGILVTFSLAILVVYAVDNFLKRKDALSCGLALLTISVAIFLTVFAPSAWTNTDFAVDYGIGGVALPVLIYFAPSKWWKLLATAAGIVILAVWLMPRQWWALLSLPFLALYNGERGKLKMKYFFYIFYPAHLVALYLIGMLM